MKCDWTSRSDLTWFYITNELALKNEERETNFENFEKWMNFVKQTCYDWFAKVLEDM